MEQSSTRRRKRRQCSLPARPIQAQRRRGSLQCEVSSGELSIAILGWMYELVIDID